ncbi:hydrogenase [soil metagenome]
MPWLVIGYGCDLAGDDGFGLSVAKLVAKSADQETALVLAQRILAPELVDKIRLADGVIFVDASATLPVGELRCTDLQELRQANQAEQSTSAILASHHCDPVVLMQLSDTLYDSRPPAWLYAVGASHFDLSENLSDTLAELVPQVASQILERMKL